MADPLPDTDSAPASATDPASGGLSAPVREGAPAPEPAIPGPRGESRTKRLYRAALGPVNSAHYLQVFERFDAAGRRQLIWHPAAGLFTLGWLVFRRLWTEALVYGVLMAAVLGLCLWAWPEIRTWPPGVRWGVLGSLLLPGVLLPGMLGHGLLHRQIQRRLLRVVSTAHSMDEARAALARQAATRSGLWVVVTVHVAVLVALGMAWNNAPRKFAGAVPPPAAPAAAEVAATPPAAVPMAHTALVTSGHAVQPTTDADPAPPVVPAPGPVIPATPMADHPPPAVPDSPGAMVMAPPAEAALSPQGASPVDQRPQAPGAAAPYAINVGLFADEGNALRAQQRLRQAGLPVLVQAIRTSKGPRTRVRVGPYLQREAAEDAAGRIRALGLEAVVFRS